MFKKTLCICFFPKRFNFFIKIDFSQKKVSMETDSYSSWLHPVKKPDSYLTGLYVNNSLWPLKLVYYFLKRILKHHIFVF